MGTKALYYENCQQREFEAVVQSCNQTPQGWTVTVNATVFYPEGGGQPCDLGTLGEAQVLDVQEQDGHIIHLCDRPLTPGACVAGRIDWDRRFDLMQQHTGEHIVSGLVHAAFGYHNVGFHMGSDVITIDFDGPIDPEALAAIEQKANEAVWQDLPVNCWYPSQEELPTVQYRSKKVLPFPVRIVEVPGYDTCACCGVHTATTGQVGLIKLLSCVKFHEGVRIEMVCGGRALELFRKTLEQNRQVSQAFSAKPLEIGDAAHRINEQLCTEKLRAAGLEKRLLETMAASFAGQGDVVHFVQNMRPATVRDLADQIASVCGGTAAVFCGSDPEGYTVCMVSRADDLKAKGAALCSALHGRGGGKPGYFQGSVQASREQILQFFQ